MRESDEARQRPSDRVGTAADNGYDISVSPSVNTVQRTVTIDGSEFTIDAIGKVDPGDDVTVSVTAPSGEEYNIEIRDRGEFIYRLDSDPVGDWTSTFDTGPTDTKDALQPRSYGAAAIKSSNVKAFHPLVVSGYAVSVQAPPTGLVGSEIRATITELPSSRETPSVDHLETAVWADGSENRQTMEAVSGDTYRATIERSAGEYSLAVIAITTEFEDGPEPVGFSDPQPLSVVENSETLSPDWTISTDSRLQYSRPAVDTDRVFLGGLGSEAIVHDRSASGGIRWTFQRDGALSDASPVLVDGTLYIASGGGSLSALDPDASAGNRLQWQVGVDSALTATPTVLGGTVYAGTNDGRVLARDASDGSERWTVGVGGPVYSALGKSTDTVFVTTADGDVLALDTDGTERWRHSTGVTLGSAPPVHRNGTVYVAADRLLALDAADGTRKWSASTYAGSAGSTPAVSGDTVYVGDRTGRVYAFDTTASGATRWSFGLPGGAAARPAVVNDRLVVADLTGTVGVLDRGTGAWVAGCTLSNAIRSPILVESGDAFVGTRDGNVEVFQGI